MLLDFIYPAPLCYEEDDRPAVLKYVHYLYFSMLLSFITLVVVVVVSLVTEEPKPEQVKPLLTFKKMPTVINTPLLRHEQWATDTKMETLQGSAHNITLYHH